MNALKFPFKFVCHRDETLILYFATLEGDEVRVDWKSGYVNKTALYTIDEITRGLVEWDAEIIQDPTPQKDERDEYIAELEAQVENLEELITMLSREDESQKQRAEGWVFKTERKGVVSVYATDSSWVPVCLQPKKYTTWWVYIDGEDPDGEGYTVVKRIK